MKKFEKEVLQAFLDEEKRVLAELEDNYAIALHDINLRLENLLGRNDADLPHVIYQIEYQKALKTQVQAILEQLQVNEFETISEYLTRCYNTGFIGSMYSFHKQGLPFLIPIDQKQVVDAIRHKTKLKQKLYDELGVDIKKLQKTIAGEISRGISTGLGYGDMARNISLHGRIPLNRAMVIARTESHRIQCQATSDAQYKAKEKGADVLKQWDSTLDGATRPNHRKLDGQIRELDEPFEVAGMKAMFPGDFGKASEDCNCRCAILQRARWALDEEELEELKKRAEYYGLDKAKDFEDYQKKYLKASEKVRDSGQKMNEEDTSQEKAEELNQDDGQKTNKNALVKVDKSSNIIFEGPIGFSNSDDAKKLEEYISNMSGQEQQKWIDAFENTDFELVDNDPYYRSRYNRDEGKVYFNTQQGSLIAFHETAHAIDEGSVLIKVNIGTKSRPIMTEISSASDYLDFKMDAAAMDADIQQLAKILGVNAKDGKFTDSENTVFLAFNKWASEITDEYGMEEFGAVSDIVSAMTDDIICSELIWGGHDKEYWQQYDDSSSFASKEEWANFASLMATRNHNMLGVLKKIAPNLYDNLLFIYRKVFEE